MVHGEDLRKAADMPHAADGTRVSAAAWQKRVLTYNTCGWSMDGDLVMARERTGEVSVYTAQTLPVCAVPRVRSDVKFECYFYSDADALLNSYN